MLVDLIKSDIIYIGMLQLRRKLGVTKSIINSILSSKKTSLDKLKHIYKVYNINYDDYWYENLLRKNKLYGHIISDTIRTLRINKGLSIQDLSKISKISIKTIQYMELGMKKKPHLYTMIHILDILSDDIDTKTYIYNTVYGKLPGNIYDMI